MEEWHRLYYSSYRPARTAREADEYDIPEAVRYQRGRDPWIRKKYEEYRRQGARFAVQLHSTERGRMPDKNFHDPNMGDRIDLQVEYHSKARKMPIIVESYKPVFESAFPGSVLYRGPVREPHSEMMTLELLNDPKYARKDRAEKMVRHFLGYTLWGLSHWNQLQEKYNT